MNCVLSLLNALLRESFNLFDLVQSSNEGALGENRIHLSEA